MKKLPLKPIVLALSLIALPHAGTVMASGFALFEQNGSGAGNSFAGGAAIAEDASTIFFNPAGLTHLKGKQIVAAGHAIIIDSTYSSNTATSDLGTPLTGGNGGNLGDTVLVPNFYFSTNLSPQLSFGVGVNVPFGLVTEYDSNWVGRYQALKSEVATLNVNPTIAWKVSDTVSLGAGISAQYIEAELSKAIDFGTACFATVGPGVCGVLGLSSQNNDGSVTIKGDDWGFGFNLGALFQITPDTRVGVAYRSRIKQELTGDASYSNVPAAFAAQPTFTNTSVKADITLPESASLSAFSQLSPKWAIMGDVTWTRWSRFKELRIKFDNGAADNVTPEEWRNTYRVAIGANYQLNDAWKLRTGLAHDRSPVKDEFRTPRIPDHDRTWLAFGASYRVSAAGVLDLGYQHGFFKDTPLNKSEQLGGTLVGKYDTKVDALSVQYTHSF
jgi:long-chain fatty acid transport protein